MKKSEVKTGQMLHINMFPSRCLGVVKELYDDFMIVEYIEGSWRLKIDIYYEKMNAVKFICKDGKPVYAKKNIFGRYKIKL
jgi:hypothetical protein